MPILPSMRRRSESRELMDDPKSDPVLLENTLRQFASINLLLTRIRGLIKQFILSEMKQAPERTYTVLDLGAGACETAVWLLKQAQVNDLKVEVTACDHDPRVVHHARLWHGGTAGLTIVEADARALLEKEHFDFVYANHLLHHLRAEEIIDLFARLAELSGTYVLLNDLRRSLTAYIGFALLAGVAFRNSFAFADGLMSIRRGFRKKELLSLLQRAGATAPEWRVIRRMPTRLAVVRTPRPEWR